MTPLRFIRSTVFTILWVLSFSISTSTVAQNSTKSVLNTDQVSAELMAHTPQGIGVGQEVWVGLQLKHQPEWHTYWKNAGDSGLPTALEWTLPPGVTAGDIAWPAPHKIRIGNLVNYGYDGKVLLPVRLRIDSNFQPSQLLNELEIKLKAFWLVCRKECIPQDGDFSLKIPLKSSTALNAAEFANAAAALPIALTEPAKLEVAGQTLQLRVLGLPSSTHGKVLDLFPETPEIIAPAAPWTQAWNGDVWTANVPLSPQRSQSPSAIPWVLVGPNGSFSTKANVDGSWPAALSDRELVTLQASPTDSPASAPTNTSFIVTLMGALLGGLILNLMPCVFPILAIKVMGVTRHTENRQAHRVSGVAYTAGVVFSFLALGAFMLGLRAAGEQLGWGFQLQSPAVIAGLATLFTALGLNLAGMFEFNQMLPSKLVTLESRNPAINAFLSGALAVAIASPCTAPFMGASLGIAATMPAPQALAVFAVLGIGMALPYLLVSVTPAVARWLPSPGAWMSVFRKFMAFPMFATVIWLIWVLGQQTGIDGAAAMLVILLAGAATLWAVNLTGRSGPIAGGVGLALLAVTVWAMGPYVLKTSNEPIAMTSNGDWQTWAPGKVEQITSANQSVFVDFTAAWCVTCQYNKKTTLSNPAVLADLQAKNITLLRADWTKRDPAIASALSALGRSGVPVYVFYQRGKMPIILSEVLGVDEIRSAIARM